MASQNGRAFHLAKSSRYIVHSTRLVGVLSDASQPEVDFLHSFFGQIVSIRVKTLQN